MTNQKLCKGTEADEEFYCVRCTHLDGDKSLFSLWKLFNSPAFWRTLFSKDGSL